MSNETKFAMVASVSTGGIITSNIEDLKLALKEKMKDYQVCTGDDALASMKSDRAELNKFIKEIEARKKAVKDEFMQPWTNFDAEMKDLVGIVKETVSTLDTEVKRIENAEREERKQKIQQFYQEYAVSKNFWNDPFCQTLYDRIYDVRWENKTVTLKTWKTAIMTAIDDYLKNIEALKARPEYFERAVEKYQMHLDIKDAWEYITNQERIKAEEEAARIRREAELEAARIRAEAEARASAEAELARAKEEAERKAAEEIERVKAEAESERVRIRAEEEAKAKADAEAKIAEAVAAARSQPVRMGQEMNDSIYPERTADASFFGRPTEPALNPQPVQQNPYPQSQTDYMDTSWQPAAGYNPFTDESVSGYTSPEYKAPGYQQSLFNFGSQPKSTCQMRIYEQDKERVREILSLNNIWFEM